MYYLKIYNAPDQIFTIGNDVSSGQDFVSTFSGKSATDKKILLNLQMQKSMEGIGSWSAEVVPINFSNGKTWFDMIQPGAMVDIFKIGQYGFPDRLKMRGYVNTVTEKMDISGPQMRVTFKGADMGIFFSKYFSLFSNTYLRGSQASAIALTSEYQQSLQAFNVVKLDLKQSIQIMFAVFLRLFGRQIGITTDAKEVLFSEFPYTFRNGHNILQEFGANAENLFAISDTLDFAYPLYNNTLKPGLVAFWDILKDWVTPHFNDMWMDTADGMTAIPMRGTAAGQVVAKPGFHIYIRPSEYNPTYFDMTDNITSIPRGFISSYTRQATDNDLYTIFLVTAQGMFNYAGAFSAGIPQWSTTLMKTWGQRMLESQIKNSFTGKGTFQEAAQVIMDFTNPNSIWKIGSERLKAMHDKDHLLWSGNIEAVNVDVKVGQKIIADLNVGDGGNDVFKLGSAASNKMKCLVESVSENIDYSSSTPVPRVSIQFTRGVPA